MTEEGTLQALEEAAELVRGAHRFAVLSHVNPDADAIGSTLGLVHGLHALGKEAVAVLSDPVPEYARFLPGADAILAALPEDGVDVLVCADAAGIDRLGKIYLENPRRFENSPLLNVDHHRTNPLFGTVNYVDPHASSTSELSYRLLMALGASIGDSVASALLFGIVGDTGSFRNGATTPGSLATAAKLVMLGADTQRIAFQLFECKTFAAARLWGRIVSGVTLDRKRHIVFGLMTQEMVREEGAAVDAAEGVAEYLRGIAEADVVMLLKETEDGNMRVSMRSRPQVDVSLIAAAFGGGGHRQAAGCTIPGPPADTRAALVAAYDALNRSSEL